MRNALVLTASRMHLMMRNKLFLFFSLIMPLMFLFLFLGILAGKNPAVRPSVFAQVIALTVMGNFWGLSVQLVMFREQGILRRFRLAPVSAFSMLASSVMANFVLTLPTIVLEFVLARYLFHMTTLGNLNTIIVMSSLGIIAFASMGLIIASVTNTMQETNVINQIIWLIFLFISGAAVPLVYMPVIVQKVALYLPATYLVSGLQRGLVEHAGVSEMIPAIISLVVTTIIAFMISTQLFRWDPEEKATRRAKLWALSAIIPFLLVGAWETRHEDLLKHSMMDFQVIDQRPAPSRTPQAPPQ